MNTKWQHEWTSGNKETSQFGFEIRKQGGQYSLYRPREDKMEWAGLFQKLADAKDAAEQLLLNELRAEYHTGQNDHLVIDGKGGIWDCTVAMELAAAREPETISKVYEIAEELPAGPIVCVPLYLVRDGAKVMRPYILTGLETAKAHGEGFSAVLLTFEEAEIARVQDASDTPLARATARSLQDTLMDIRRLKPEADRCRSRFVDLVKRVRESAKEN